MTTEPPQSPTLGDWVLVPRAPTAKMKSAGAAMCDDSTPEEDTARAGGVWWAMLAAAPPIPDPAHGETAGLIADVDAWIKEAGPGDSEMTQGLVRRLRNHVASLSRPQPAAEVEGLVREARQVAARLEEDGFSGAPLLRRLASALQVQSAGPTMGVTAVSPATGSAGAEEGGGR